jgi:polar amino acid transport system substrate-binding protein
MMKQFSYYLQLAAALLFFSVLPLQADMIEEILERGTLKVGVSLFEPWTMKSESGELYGFEVDVANKLAEDMGVDTEFVVYEWSDIIEGLVSGEIDLIVGGMAITPERALKVNFTQPYANSGITMVTNTAMTQDIDNLEDLNQPDTTFVVVTGSTAETLVKTLFDNATLMVVKEAADAAKAILSGNVHVYVAASPQPEFLAMQNPGTIDIPLLRPLLTYKAGIAVPKGEQELLNFLNAWITARDADKWLSASHKYWFGSLEWR